MVSRRSLFSAPALLLSRAQATRPRPNILLIVSEDNGPHFGCYGDRTVPTPHVDALAASGNRYENAYVTQAVCSPSRSSILTGLYPHQNGQIGLATHAFTMVRNWPTLPGLLKQAGYRTGLIGKLHVNPEPAFAFDYRWADRQFLSFGHRDVGKTAEVAGEFMSRGGPFFLMVCYADAHLPFLRQQAGLPVHPLNGSDVRMFPAVGIDTPRLREHVANYYNSISRLDSGIGMLLAKLKDGGQEDGTLVAYLGDHGAQFSRGKTTSYEFALRIPLVLRWPGRVRAGGVNRELASTVDLLPTLLDAAAAQVPRGLPGRSLLSGRRNRKELFCEWNTSHSVPGPSIFYPQRTVRDRRYKLILNLLAGRRNPAELCYTAQVLIQTGATQAEIDASAEPVRNAYRTWRNSPRLELYDLEKDPFEFVNLAERAEFSRIGSRLLAKLTDWQRQTSDPLADPAKLALLDAEDHEVSKRPDGARSRGFRWRYPEYLYATRS
ncbi:MAG: sulfatase [Bryobacteraceae bacterium]